MADNADLEKGDNSSADSPVLTDPAPVDIGLVQEKILAAREKLDQKGGLAGAISKLMNFFKDRLTLGLSKNVGKNKKENFWLDDSGGAYANGGKAVMDSAEVDHTFNQALQRRIGY